MPLTWPPDEPVLTADHSQKEAANTFRQFGRLIIEAAPGTGKTFLGVYLALCAYRLGWTSSEYPTLFLTFSRNARVQIEQALKAFRSQGWMTPQEEKAFKIYNYHAFFFDLLQRKAGTWGCREKLRPASIEEHRTRIAALVPDQINDRDFLNQANLVYALQRFPIGELLKRDDEIKLNREALGQLRIDASTALRNGRPYYDDFAPLFLNLLELCPELVKWLRLTYPVIILDEFQDTDIVQWSILQKINPIHPVILYDRYQMIYEWRGARLERLDHVIQHLNIQPEQERHLTDIHRCGNQASLIQFIQELRVDDLLGNAVDGRRSRPWLSTHSIQRPRGAQQMPAEIRCLRWLRFNSQIVNFQETTAILTRTNFLADYLYSHLRVRPDQGGHLRCQWIGSEDNPDERIRDWIWHLRAVHTNQELMSWLGGILDELLPETIRRDLDTSFSEEFLKSHEELFLRRRKDIFQVVKSSWLPVWRSVSVDNCQSLSIGIKQVLSSANDIVSENAYLDPDLVYYLKQLGAAADKYQCQNTDAIWQDFCDHLENSHQRATFLKIRDQTSGLYILTIHQSKGREFDHVIIPWLSRRGEPNRFARLDYARLEDRKLLYVAISRAKRKVTILYPDDDPSPFLRNWKLIA